ncbi:MAG: hypothetical protein H9W81_13835 [Enterococcus sp.]|nr:hypothetical protein [Enterococcus sp.]
MKQIGHTYRYYSSLHRKKINVMTGFYAFFLFVFLSTAGKSIGLPLMFFITVVMFILMGIYMIEIKVEDKRHLQRYTVKRESMDDHGNSKILVEWHKDKLQVWIPNLPAGFQRFRVISE